MSMSDGELARLQRQVADELARRRAESRARPGWQVALDELLMANYGNPAFWLRLRSVLFGAGCSDEDLDAARQFYAKRCRVCGAPLHQAWSQCTQCGADNYGPEVIKGTTVAAELEPPEPEEDEPGPEDYDDEGGAR